MCALGLYANVTCGTGPAALFQIDLARGQDPRALWADRQVTTLEEPLRPGPGRRVCASLEDRIFPSAKPLPSGLMGPEGDVC